MRQTGLAVLALLALILAGCSDAPSTDPVPDAAPTSSMTGTASEDAPTAAPDAPAVLPTLDFLDCTNHGGAFSMPRADAVALLPDGFEPVTATDPTRDQVILYAIAVECQDSAIDGDATGPVSFSYAELAVTPPDDMTVQGIQDCTVPLAFIVNHLQIGAVLESYQLGDAGAGSRDSTFVGSEEGGATMVSYQRPPAALEFIFGEASADTLAVGNGDFVLYGVQDRQVVSAIVGTSAGDAASAHYASAMFRTSGVPGFTLQDATLGFGATGFSLHFAPEPVATA